MRPKFLSLCTGLALSCLLPSFARQSGPNIENGRQIIRQMAERYRPSPSGILIQAEIERKEEIGPTGRETTRRYRLVQSGDRLRIDSNPDAGATPIIYMRRGCVLIFYTSVDRLLAERPCTSKEGAPIEWVLSRIEKTLRGRLADLADTDYTIDSVAVAKVKIAGTSRDCHKIAIHNKVKDTSERWSAKLWIDRATSQIWRADLRWAQRGTRVAFERVTWLETRTGPDVPLAELDWKPPADAKPRQRIPPTLPQ